MNSTFRIGALFPMVRSRASNYRLDTGGILRLHAFLMAIDEINDKSDGVDDWLLPLTRLEFVVRDTKRDPITALIGALEVVGTCGTGDSSSLGVVATVGAASSEPSKSAAQAFTRSRTPQISYSSTSAALSNGLDYPYFLRTPPSDAFQAKAMVDLLVGLWNYSAVATVATAGDTYSTSGMEVFFQHAEARNLTILASLSIPEQGDFSGAYRELRNSRARIIVLFCQRREAARFLGGAPANGVGGEGFLYMGSDAVAQESLWQDNEQIFENVTLRNAALKGFFGLQPSFNSEADEYLRYVERLRLIPSTLPTANDEPGSGVSGNCSNVTDADGRPVWWQEVEGAPLCIGVSDPSQSNTYAPFAYDAIYAIARALHHLIYVQRATVSGDALMSALLDQVDFVGATGRVNFYHDPSDSTRQNMGDRRIGTTYSVVNYQLSGEEGSERSVPTRMCLRSARLRNGDDLSVPRSLRPGLDSLAVDRARARGQLVALRSGRAERLRLHVRLQRALDSSRRHFDDLLNGRQLSARADADDRLPDPVLLVHRLHMRPHRSRVRHRHLVGRTPHPHVHHEPARLRTQGRRIRPPHAAAAAALLLSLLVGVRVYARRRPR